MDQATITYYTLGYIAWIIAAFLLFLPAILSFVLLLVVATAIQLVVLFLKAVARGVWRSLVRLFGNVNDGLPHGRGGDGLVPP